MDPNKNNCNNCSPEKQRVKEAGDVELRPQLGLLNAIAMIVGSIVGSGIFISPKGVLESTGSAEVSIIVWALCGVIAFIGALCYAELGEYVGNLMTLSPYIAFPPSYLGTMITSSGGDYAYLNEAFGNLPAFLYLWAAFFIIMPVCSAIIALTFANYVLQPFWGTCPQSSFATRLVAAFAVGSELSFLPVAYAFIL